MKLATKITAVIFIVITFLLTLNTLFSVRREIELFNMDMRNDAELLGDAMKTLIVNVWRNSGEFQALQVIENLNARGTSVHMRWIWFEELANDPFIPPANKSLLEAIMQRRETIFIEAKHKDGRYLHTFVPVQIDNFKIGAIELMESLAPRDQYIATTILHSGLLLISMLAFSGVLLWFVGARMVGRPLQQLVEKTHRIGGGDLSPDVVLKGRNELTELADAFNKMCESLSAAQKKARRETEKRIAALQELRHSERLATVGRLASGIAHELGTPLNVVSGRAKMIAAEPLSREEVVEFATIIHDQAERMTKIIRQLLDFSRRRAPQRSLTNVPQLIRQIKDMLDPIAKKNNVEIVLIEDSPPPISLDQGQIQQVLINLIMNAIQAMPGGGTVKVAAFVREETKENGRRGSLVITVTDNGQGISAENRQHIFEPFFTTKQVGAGTGLGLSITYGIIKEHGGDIDVESEPGKGTRFTITLPMEIEE